MRPEVISVVRLHLSPSMEVREVLYDRDNSCALQCFRPYDSSFFVVKAKYLSQDNELIILHNLNHDSILTLFSYEEIAFGEDKVQLLYMKYSEMTLRKKIENRVLQQFPWTEEELTSLLVSLTAAFAYMQNRNIAHRDITPDHIFVTGEGKVSVGDLEKAKEIRSDRNSVAGTQKFASPAVQQAMNESSEFVTHNAFKSDVYSLGVMFLQMATLSPHSIYTVSTLDSLPFSGKFKKCLSSMLAECEIERSDFLQLQKMLQPWAEVSFRPIVREAEQESQANMIKPGFELEKVPLSERKHAQRDHPQPHQKMSVLQRCWELCDIQ